MDVLVGGLFVTAYKECGEKYPHEWAREIHRCARKKLRKQGFRTHVVGRSIVGGTITIKKSDPDDPCGTIHDHVTLQHELRHKAHEEIVRKEHPDEDEAFEILAGGAFVAAEEAEDYRVEVVYLNDLIARLDALCAAREGGQQ